LEAASQNKGGQERGGESRSHPYTMSHQTIPLNLPLIVAVTTFNAQIAEPP
jgi:hypothetical protein